MRTRAPDDDMTGRTVIVGAGQAGARTAAALRHLDDSAALEGRAERRNALENDHLSTRLVRRTPDHIACRRASRRRIACAEIADVGRPLPSQARAQT